MLSMGARYFEFRPAKLYPLFKETSDLRDTHYYTHANLPGLTLDTFLTSIVAFLSANVDEIVVLHIRFDGVVSACAPAKPEEVDTYLANACRQSATPLSWTDKTGLGQSIDSLRKTGRRIIILTNTSQYSSYGDVSNATLTPAPIVAAFNAMTTSQQESADITLLQCQATATNLEDVVIYSVLSSNASNSPLAATKVTRCAKD